MTYYLLENPWPLVAILAVVAVVFLVLLKTTQDGRHLIRLVAVLGAIGLVLLTEWVWVTEDERIEKVVYQLADAMAHSDGDRVSSLFAPEISMGLQNKAEHVQVDPALFREVLGKVEFDWLKISRLQTHSGVQTRQGSAVFRVIASGSIQGASNSRLNFATGTSDWSLGLRKDPNGDWKITRINPVSLPYLATQAVQNFINRIARKEPLRPRFPEIVTPPEHSPERGMRRGSFLSPRVSPIN